MKAKLQLNNDQLNQLEPLFEEVRKINDANHSDGINNFPPMIAAQIYEDGIICKVFSSEEALSLSVALGGNGGISHSLAGRK